jgi:hypothetical protein
VEADIGALVALASSVITEIGDALAGKLLHPGLYECGLSRTETADLLRLAARTFVRDSRLGDERLESIIWG